MKYHLAFLAAALLAIPTIATAITIDGVADTSYGSAISTQALGTAALNNNIATNIGLANGSELDAAYGFVSNGVLYLTFAGNFDTQSGFVPYDVLHTFFMADAGVGGDHTLTGFYNGTFGGRINNMVGMTFDTGFTPNYWIGVNSGQPATTNPVSMFVDYVVICSNCPSSFLGSVNPPIAQPAAILTNVYFGNVMQFAMDNSNTGGVNSTTCTTNLQGAAQSVAASAVRSGIEMAIPLATIGSPTGTVRVCSFLTEQTMTYIYNQALGPFDGGVPYCLDTLDGATTLTSYFDFNSYPGQHYFTISVPPCDVLLVNPATAFYTSTGGVGSVTVANSGGCALTVTTNVSWLSVTSSSGVGSGNGSFTYSVEPNTNSIQTRTGKFIITDTEGSGNVVTQTVTITQTGVSAPPLSTIFTIDGTVDPAYGCPVAVQLLSTSYGKNTNTDLLNAGGSELDAAYGLVLNDTLFLVLAGNIQANNNRVHIFFMTGPGGQSSLTNVNPNGFDQNSGRSVLNWMGATNSPPGPGLTFDAGFAPNYYINMSVSTVLTASFNYAQLWPGATNSSGVATNGYFLGRTGSTNGTLLGGRNPFGIQATVNDSNTNGVDKGNASTGCYTNALGVAGGNAVQALAVTTGVEMGIPLAALGSPTGAIAICAFIGNNGNGLQMSDQILGSFGTNDPNFCMLGPGKVTNMPYVVLGNYPGQHYFLVGPEMRVTGVSKSGNDIIVNYLTEANTNLTYQVQRASTLMTNATWISVGGLQLGTGGIISQNILNGATNRPAQFYRVRQTPLCP